MSILTPESIFNLSPNDMSLADIPYWIIEHTLKINILDFLKLCIEIQ